MSEQGIIKKYRTEKRRSIKSEINAVCSENERLFKLWAYDKSLDVDFLKKSARQNLLRLENLQKIYDATASEIVSVETARIWLNVRGVVF